MPKEEAAMVRRGCGKDVVTVVVAVLKSGWLAWRKRFRSAAWWAASVAGCVICTVMLKLGFHAGFFSLQHTSLHNPSGHAAMSVTVYGGDAWIVAANVGDWRRPMLLTIGLLAGVSIGLAMVYLGPHTAADFISGIMIGAVWLGIFCQLGLAQDRPPYGNPLPLVVAITAVAVFANASHVTTERIGALLQLPPALARF